MKNILLTPTNPVSLNEMIKTANILLGGQNISFYLNNHFSMENINRIKKYNFNTYQFENQQLQEKVYLNQRKFNFLYFRSILMLILKILIKANFTSFFARYYLKKSSIKIENDIERKKKYFVKLLTDIKINLVILASERSYEDIILISVCKKLKIKTIVIPVSYLANPETLKFSRENWKYNQKLFGFLKSDKKIFYTDKLNKKYFFYEAAVTFALCNKNIMINNPWAINGGEADNILIESKWHLSEYEIFEPSRDKIIITGHSAYDDIFNIKKRKKYYKKNIIEKYSLELNTKIILLSMPQFIEDTVHGNGYSIQEATNELHYLLNEISKVSRNVIISLHPKMDRKQYDEVVKKYKFKICDETLGQLIPLADIFVVWISSTVTFSILSEVPSLVINYTKEKFDRFDVFSSVIKINNKNELKKNLEKVNKETIKIINCSNYKMLISNFDGNCKERIKSILLN